MMLPSSSMDRWKTANARASSSLIHVNKIKTKVPLNYLRKSLILMDLQATRKLCIIVLLN